MLYAAFVKQSVLGTTISPQQHMPSFTARIDFLKQKVYAWANRIRQYKKRGDRFNQNHMFQRNEKWVYWKWEKPSRNGQFPDENATNTYILA